jgi:DNA-binding FadR family transcriptional regulator
MTEALELRLSLLRGETGNPIELEALGRSAMLRMQLQHKSALSDRLAMNLLGMIAEGQLATGHRVPSERAIAEATSVSRVCVRAALERLKAQGYLEAVRGAGTRVAPGPERLTALRAANRENIHDLGRFCQFLDGLLMREALRRRPPQAIGALLAPLLDRSAGSFKDHARREHEARQALAEASGSAVLRLLISRMQRGFRGYYRSVLSPSVAGPVRRRLDAATRDTIRHAEAGATEALSGAFAARGRLLRAASDAAMQHPVALPGPDRAAILQELAARPPERLSETIGREIAAMIATGQLGTNECLLGERRLADLFGVSRVTVRQALAGLKADGLVTASERHWTRANTEETDEFLAAGLTDSMVNSHAEYRVLCHLRHHLEVWAARRAARRARPQDKRDLRRILAEMRRPTHSAERAIDLDLNLHLTIARSTGSALHLFVTEVLRNAVTGYFDYSLKDPRFVRRPQAALLAQHEAIVAAILAHDPEAAGVAMDAHVSGFRDSYAAGHP